MKKEMCEDEKLKDESKEANEFIDALLKKTLDDHVGFVRGHEPMMVTECISAKNKPSMLWYFSGYCLCSRFYSCRHQGRIEIVEGKERSTCTKYEKGEAKKE